MADYAAARRIVRCPECDTGVLSTPTFVVRTARTARYSVPVKVCRRCKVLLLHDKTWLSGWKIWNRSEYVSAPE